MRLSSLALLFAVVATGCQEAPSYAVRWRIAPRTDEALPPTAEPQDEEMTNPSVCSRSGVSLVEVWVLDELDNLADQFTRPCFPERFRREGGAVRGATLPPGDYTALVAGTRANGVPWGTCPGDSGLGDNPVCHGKNVGTFLDGALSEGTSVCDNDGNCFAGLGSCDCQTFTVVADEVARLPDFELAAPPDCEDGVDGDEDGLVDQLDPGCQLGFSESTPVLIPELALSLSVLSRNPNAVCKSIDVGVLSLAIDGTPFDDILCRVGISRFSTPLAVGSHELTVVGTDSAGVPKTLEKTLPFVVNERGVSVPEFLEVDFADVDLLEPLESSAKFLPVFQLPEEQGSSPVSCLDARVAVDDFRIRLYDLGGRLVEPSPLTSASVVLDGTSTSCETIGGSIASITTVEPLRWGGYLVEVEAYNADGELCWSNAGAPTPLEPADAVTVVAELVDGAPADCVGG